jgi:potassium-transporting ATPase KdpC subunit
MNPIRELLTALRSTIVLWMLTAILYPVLILLIGQGLFPNQANGSLLKNPQGTVIGSTLIGQSFTSDKYFWSRPSTINYSSGKETPMTGVSGASNLAASNPDLVKRVKERITELETTDLPKTADLIYTSGSGLDPHISLKSAQAQIERVAKTRRLNSNQVEILITKNIDYPFLGVFGEAGVNVLKLNLALDKLGGEI